eukprot:12550945-Alexandrium_andersonii.AAC.2
MGLKPTHPHFCTGLQRERRNDKCVQHGNSHAVSTHGVQQVCSLHQNAACEASDMDTTQRAYATTCATHPHAHTCSVSVQRGAPSMDTRIERP